MPEILEQVLAIPVKSIYSDSTFNCRGEIESTDVLDLQKSIEANGLQIPILLQPFNYPGEPDIQYKIVSGHRRFQAFKNLRKPVVPSIVRTGLSELQARKLNLEENLKRKDLNMLQEAKALMKLRSLGLNQDDVAREIQMSRGWVQVRFMIMDLCPEVQQEVAAGNLTQAHIRELHGMPYGQQIEVTKKIKEFREAGEKRSIQIKKPVKNPFAKKVRLRHEIFEMQDHIQQAVGNNFGTRCLAWAAGEISDMDIYTDLKTLAENLGKHYEIDPRIKKTFE